MHTRHSLTYHPLNESPIHVSHVYRHPKKNKKTKRNQSVVFIKPAYNVKFSNLLTLIHYSVMRHSYVSASPRRNLCRIFFGTLWVFDYSSRAKKSHTPLWLKNINPFFFLACRNRQSTWYFQMCAHKM